MPDSASVLAPERSDDVKPTGVASVGTGHAGLDSPHSVGDILGEDFSKLNEDSLYRNLDRLHWKREQIERELAEGEKTLFNLDETLYLYDLTSTYFEGQAEANAQAKRGYSPGPKVGLASKSW